MGVFIFILIKEETIEGERFHGGTAKLSLNDNSRGLLRKGHPEGTLFHSRYREYGIDPRKERRR
jgi:hypothetical protein